MRSLRVVTSRWFVLALAAGVLMAGLTVYMTGGARAAGYSKASLKGTYIFRGSGVGLSAAPNQPSAAPGFAAGFGTVSFDGAGHFTGTQTVSSTPMQEVPTPGPRRATGEKANPVAPFHQTQSSRCGGGLEAGARRVRPETLEADEKGRNFVSFSTPVQQQIDDLVRHAKDQGVWRLPITVFKVFCLPLIWYFLLDRVRELGAADLWQGPQSLKAAELRQSQPANTKIIGCLSHPCLRPRQ